MNRQTTQNPLLSRSTLKQAPRHAQRLQRVLERERARVDRTGGVISLAMFYFERPALWPSRRMKRLIQALDTRARITDEIGRIDRSRAFVLLPDTPPGGGRRFAEDVVELLARRGIKVDFVVFRYASGRPRRQSDHSNANGSSSGHGPIREPKLAPAPLTQDQLASDHAPDSEPTECLVRHFSPKLPGWKRVMDIAFALTGLVGTMPVFVLAAIAIKLDSPGPVFFKQWRTGHGRTRFQMYKFRTMVSNAESLRDTLLAQNEQDGPAFKIRHDPRVTRVGRWLRKTSIDEFPQFINILRGDMTVVGPRPLPCHEAEACESWQDRRHSVHPGITCIWQVRGRSRVSFEEWARMDLAYARRVSLWNDVKIMAMTVPAVLRQDGAQ